MKVCRISSALVWRIMLLSAAIFLGPISLGLLQLSCSGNTTGVDNPGFSEIPISFRDAEGSPVAVQGEIEIYAGDQNPALYPDPLLRVPVQNRSFITLAAENFNRIADSTSVPGDSLLRFNVLFRNAMQSGQFASGFVYNKIRQTFRNENASSPKLEIMAQSFTSFAASLRREAVHGELGRVYLPGTPFQATLSESLFVFSRLPQGRYVMRLLNAEGQIFAVRESVDTRQVYSFTANPEPLGRVDSAYPYPAFTVNAGADQSVPAGDTLVLKGLVLGLDPADARVSVLWRIIKPLPGDSVWIESPTRLSTRVRFPNPGAYGLELSVSLGSRTLHDTLLCSVQAPAAMLTTFLSPRPGDNLYMGVEIKVVYESGWNGLARLEYAYDPIVAGSWKLIADSIPLNPSPGGGVQYWAPPPMGSGTQSGSFRLLALASDSILATSGMVFFQVPP